MKPFSKFSAPAADAQPAAGTPEKDRSLGLVYGALTKAAKKLLGSPKAVNALMQNPKTAEVAAQLGASGNPLAKYKK